MKKSTLRGGGCAVMKSLRYSIINFVVFIILRFQNSRCIRFFAIFLLEVQRLTHIHRAHAPTRTPHATTELRTASVQKRHSLLANLLAFSVLVRLLLSFQPCLKRPSINYSSNQLRPTRGCVDVLPDCFTSIIEVLPC